MSNIKLKVKLSAYTKGIIPVKISQLENDLDFITEAPDDGITYLRGNKTWIPLSEIVKDQTIILDDNSGLNLRDLGNNLYALSVRQKVINTLDQVIEEDTTYYLDDKKPELFITGGTAFSDEQHEFYQEAWGGRSGTSTFTVSILPIDSKGVYNG